MNTSNPEPTYLADYRPPAFLIDYLQLTFILGEQETEVRARSAIRRNAAISGANDELWLDGEELELMGVYLDGEQLDQSRVELRERGLIIKAVPEAFSLEIITKVNPENNSALSGLYLSSGNFCTQCEAEGFRRITYYTDRPDVLARFTTRIEAHSTKFPVLLANGNLIEQGELEHGYHYAVWEDPFPKPSYLFALVAGNLVALTDRFQTASGRQVALEIYVQARNRDKCAHAMESLKKAMRWDEEVFGLEYDLDRYMIVAVDDFNMGAMENKGLNIFNSKYVLASPETATDEDYLGIEGVIAHEYFHNWTGNRVTCRDWFQLSLKEGLTVFRDQEFSSDMNSRPVQRIDDVRILRQHQFREDGGPMAHPVRPASYLEINNFYTVTVYNKGAEVVRMIHTLIGAECFRKGMELYFQRHDGQAVTCEDFVAAMSDSAAMDLEQFKRWYHQAGTPHLTATERWDGETGTYELGLHQRTPATPGQPKKQPFHLPILVGLLDESGQELADRVNCPYARRGDSFLLELIESAQFFTFKDLPQKPIVSLLRQFSAPVKLEPFHSRATLGFLMSHDSDLFNRWDAAQALGESIILEIAEALRIQRPCPADRVFVEAFRKNLQDSPQDRALAAQALSLPAEAYLAQSMETVWPEQLHLARELVKQELARELESELLQSYRDNRDRGPYRLAPDAIGSRSLSAVCLDYLVSCGPKPERVGLCRSHYFQADNMTDRIGALKVITNLEVDEREEMLEHFERTWFDETLVMDKWFAIQAASEASDTFTRVQKLMKHPVFSLRNPNKVRSLIGSFTANHYRFHDRSGCCYRFLTDIVLEVDAKNPQIAARLLQPLTHWKRYDPERRGLMHQQLERILGRRVSRDVYEIASKSVNEPGPE